MHFLGSQQRVDVDLAFLALEHLENRILFVGKHPLDFLGQRLDDRREHFVTMDELLWLDDGCDGQWSTFDWSVDGLFVSGLLGLLALNSLGHRRWRRCAQSLEDVVDSGLAQLMCLGLVVDRRHGRRNNRFNHRLDNWFYNRGIVVGGRVYICFDDIVFLAAATIEQRHHSGKWASLVFRLFLRIALIHQRWMHVRRVRHFRVHRRGFGFFGMKLGVAHSMVIERAFDRPTHRLTHRLTLDFDGRLMVKRRRCGLFGRASRQHRRQRTSGRRQVHQHLWFVMSSFEAIDHVFRCDACALKGIQQSIATMQELFDLSTRCIAATCKLRQHLLAVFACFEHHVSSLLLRKFDF